MNREIKFKFVIDNKFLTEPYTLDEILEKSKEDIIIDLDNKYGDCNCLNEGCGHCECQSIFEDSEITGKIQFTGLKDKNGKEIYEGDIVNVKYSDGSGYDNPVEISFEKGSFWCGMGYLNDVKIIEVIGNIYENPNLLTK